MPNYIETNSIKGLEIYACRSEVQLARYFEPDEGIFIAESPKVIERALNAGYTPLSLLTERKHIEGELADIIPQVGDVPIYIVSDSVTSEIIEYNLTRGALCAFRRKALPAPETLCRDAKRIAVLENVVNPTNVGAIIRSAAALKVGAVLLTEGCSDPLYRRAIRVSMGTVFQIPWTFLSGDYMDKLHSMGFKTAALALTDNSVSVNDPQVCAEERLAMILGTEGDGLSADTIAKSDYTVKIPMADGVDSLNVAAASAVAFWQMCK